MTNSTHLPPQTTDADSEQSQLDRVLRDSDSLLANSLRDEERRQRRRRLFMWLLSIGGIAMCALVLAWSAGWLTMAAVAPDKAEAETLTQQGWALWQQQRFAEAVKPFEKAVELDPKNANAWNGLGWARFNSGDAEEAIEAFEKCVKLEPKNPAALNGLGQIHLMWREYDQAEKYLKKASPTASAAWFGLARLYLLEGKYTEAQKWIRKSLAQQPGDETLKLMLASAKAKQLDDELRRQIEGPGRPKRSSGSDLAAKGWRNFNQGKAAEAEKAFRGALKAEPENLAAMNGLGFLLVNSGKPKEAITYFEKYLELEPNAPGPMNGLARCQYALDKVDEAIATWEKMYEKHPGPNAAAVGLAQTYLEREEFSKAIPYFEVLDKAQPDNSQWSEGLEAAKEGAKEAESK